LHMTLRKVIKTRASFPSEEAALKLLYLALQNVSKRWKPAPNWRTALNHFTLLYSDRMEAAWNRAGTIADRAYAPKPGATARPAIVFWRMLSSGWLAEENTEKRYLHKIGNTTV